MHPWLQSSEGNFYLEVVIVTVLEVYEWYTMASDTL